MIKKIWNRLSVTAQLSVALVCFIAGIILAIEANIYLYQKPLTEKRFERLMEINGIQQEDFISCELKKPFPNPPWIFYVVYKSQPDMEYKYGYDWALIVTDDNCWPKTTTIRNVNYSDTDGFSRAEAIAAFESGQNLIFPHSDIGARQ